MFHRAWLLHWFFLFLHCILLLQHLFLFLFYLLYFHIHFLFSYFLYSASFILLFLCSNYNWHIFFFINPYCFLSLFHISEVSYFFSYCICISFCCNVIHKDGQTYFYIHNLIFLTNLICYSFFFFVLLFNRTYLCSSLPLILFTIQWKHERLNNVYNLVMSLYWFSEIFLLGKDWICNTRKWCSTIVILLLYF